MMNKKQMKQTVSAVFLMATIAGAQASTVSLVPASPTVVQGDTIVLDLNVDFSDDPTLGGGLDIFYDPALVSFVSYDTNPGSGSDPAFSRDPDDQGDKLEGLAFGNFNGISGPVRIGTLTFDTLAAGTAIFGIDVTTNMLVGGFVSSVTFDTQMPDFVGATVEIKPVPVPAAIWLFGTGLIGLAGMARRA